MKNETIEVGETKQISKAAFSSPAYRRPRYEIGERWGEDYTGENPSAHGNIVVTEEESREGRQRRVAINGNHREVGPWSPTRAQREDYARREAAKAKAQADAEEDAAAKALGISLVSVDGETVTCQVNGKTKTVNIAAIRDAARDPSHPRLTPEQARAQETAEDRILRLAYRSLLRQSAAKK